MQADRIISELAARQHGVVGRRQLLAAGVSRHALEGRLDAGLLVAVHAGVYRLAASPVGWTQRIMAGVLAAGPGAVASHRSAGFLHGLAGVEPRVEVTVGRRRAPRPPGVVVHRFDGLGPGDPPHPCRPHARGPGLRPAHTPRRGGPGRRARARPRQLRTAPAPA